MSITRVIPRVRAGSWWRCCLGLMVLAWTLRALVPVGYMPTVVQDYLVLSVCSGHQVGAGLLQVVEIERQEQGLQEQICPYALLAAQATLPPAPNADAWQPYLSWILRLAPGQLALARAPPPGLPLGSRAPPVSMSS